MTFPITVAGATRIGRRHESEGMPNQDSFRYRTIPEQQILVAAVSDGAGSSSKSQVSSSIAVLRAVDVTTQALVNDASIEMALRSGFEAAMSAVHRMAARDHCHDISSYHATLVLAAWTPDGVAAIQVGDGAAIVTTPDGPKMLTIPQQGEYANETYFITMPQAPDIVFFNHTEDADGLIIFTDGLQKQAVDFANKRPYPEFVDAAIGASAHENEQTETVIRSSSSSRIRTAADLMLHEWLSREQVAENNSDDSTIIVASRMPDDD